MLEVTNLSKTYRGKGTEDVQALKGVSFTLPDTGMVFILGKSGSGKSTLLNLLGGLDAKTGKEILLLLKRALPREARHRRLSRRGICACVRGPHPRDRRRRHRAGQRGLKVISEYGSA